MKRLQVTKRNIMILSVISALIVVILVVLAIKYRSSVFGTIMIIYICCEVYAINKLIKK